jgi:hypothetical protein
MCYKKIQYFAFEKLAEESIIELPEYFSPEADHKRIL